MGKNNQISEHLRTEIIAHYTRNDEVSVSQTARHFLMTFGQVKKVLVDAGVFRPKPAGNYVERAMIRRKEQPGRFAKMEFFKKK